MTKYQSPLEKSYRVALNRVAPLSVGLVRLSAMKTIFSEIDRLEYVVFPELVDQGSLVQARIIGRNIRDAWQSLSKVSVGEG